MILINLLPHREIARKKRKEAFYLNVVLSAFCGLAISLLVYMNIQAKIDIQKQRNFILRDAAAKIDEEIKEVASLRTEILALKARQNAVENLQSDRNTPVYLLEDLVLKLPEGIHLVSVRQEGKTLSLVGVAQSQERVSELLRELGESQSISRPDLVEIVSIGNSLSPKETRRLFNFTIRGDVKRREEDFGMPEVKVEKI